MLQDIIILEVFHKPVHHRRFPIVGISLEVVIMAGEGLVLFCIFPRLLPLLSLLIDLF